MAVEINASHILRAERSAERSRRSPQDKALANGGVPALGLAGQGQTGPRPGVSARGLLVTADAALVRAFRRELRHCADYSVSFEVRSSFEEARSHAAGPYHWVAVDLDGAIAPSQAVRLARRSWPTARVAVLSCWWSERDAIARDLADVVIHKPFRSPELRAFLRAPAGVPQREVVSAVTG